MKIAIDKNSISKIESSNEYIYLFEDESLDELLNTKLHCVYYKDCKYVDINTTDYDIDCIKKCKMTDENWNQLPEFVNYKIGIIIPNYNYAHTIEKCLESILNQTYENYEIIFVDDMSTDNSVKIAQDTYLKWLVKNGTKNEDYDKLKIIQLQQKRLNGGARNEAYLHLSDDIDYVYYVDSDDWLYNDECLEMINRNLQNKPDVLFVGMAKYKNDKLSTCFIPNYKNKYEAMQGWSGSCGKVIKKSLATRQECLYNEGTLKEDRNQHRKICIYMNSFKLLQKPIYVWNQSNDKSVTTVRCENPLWKTSTIRQYADTLELYLKEKGKDKMIDKILLEAVNKTKTEMLEGGDKQW